MNWKRVASVPLDGGRYEAIICIWANPRGIGAPGIQIIGINGPSSMTPIEARMLAAAIVAASREAEAS